MITLNQCQCMLCAGVEVDACASSWHRELTGVEVDACASSWHLPRPEGCRGEGNSEVVKDLAAWTPSWYTCAVCLCAAFGVRVHCAIPCLSCLFSQPALPCGAKSCLVEGLLKG